MFVTTAFAQSATTTTEPAVHGEAAEGATHSETGMPNEGAHSAAFPPFDPTHFPSQILWLAISFGAFYYLMSKMIAPRIGGIIAAREQTIASDLADANRMKGDADAAIAAYEKDLADAKAKAGAIASEARDKAKAKADADRRTAEASLAEKIAAAEADIAAIKAKALAGVGGIAEDAATAIVEQLTGTKVSKTDVAAAVKAATAK